MSNRVENKAVRQRSAEKGAALTNELALVRRNPS